MTDQTDKLRTLNGELCAEINRQERRIRELEALLDVGIVRCGDCAYSIHFFHHDDERWQCAEPHQEGDDMKPDAYCWRGERKEVGE